jgi:hypothetical protein
MALSSVFWLLQLVFSLRFAALLTLLGVALSVLTESESCVTTDGQSASLSWNKARIWGSIPDFYYCQTVAGFLMWGALSDNRTGLSFTVAAAPRQRSHSRVRVPWTCDHIILSQIRNALIVASYDSQGGGGGVRTRLHCAGEGQQQFCSQLGDRIAYGGTNVASTLKDRPLRSFKMGPHF